MLKISLAGDLGSGKSTVSKILIERLGAEYYSTGRVVRDIAEKRGMTVVELNQYMETHPEIDHEIDDGLVALSDSDKSLIIDSRMAWHFTRNTFKVYLSTDIETSALRIMGANRKGEHSATLEETIASTVARRESEKKRYFQQYGVHIKDLSNYDLVVDTTYATPEEIAERIIVSAMDWQEGKISSVNLYISPERLLYPDEEADMMLSTDLSGQLEEGLAIPSPIVTERNGDFYLIGNETSAIAYSLNMATFIPAILKDAPIPEGDFVKMKNSL